MGKVIILEGPDGAGKTTLIKSLAKDLGIEVAPRACTSEGGPVERLYEWTTDNLNYKIKTLDELTIHDRYPLFSEPIYGPLIRGSMAEGFDSAWYSQAWKAFFDIRPIVIFCLPNVETVVKNVQAESASAQMDGVTFNIRSIYWLYYNLLTRLRATKDIQTMLWDYEDHLCDVNYKEILRYLQKYKEKRAAGEYQRY